MKEVSVLTNAQFFPKLTSWASCTQAEPCVQVWAVGDEQKGKKRDPLHPSPGMASRK